MTMLAGTAWKFDGDKLVLYDGSETLSINLEINQQKDVYEWAVGRENPTEPDEEWNDNRPVGSSGY